MVCQSAPALAILLPGRACGMPYAPEVALLAVTFHPLSWFHSGCRQLNCELDQPNEPSMLCAICCGSPCGVAAEAAELLD